MCFLQPVFSVDRECIIHMIISFLEAEFGSCHGAVLLTSNHLYVRVDLSTEGREEETSRPAEPDETVRRYLDYSRRTGIKAVRSLQSENPGF